MPTWLLNLVTPAVAALKVVWSFVSTLTGNYKLEAIALAADLIWLAYLDLLAKNTFGAVFFAATLLVNVFLGFKYGAASKGATPVPTPTPTVK